MKKQTVKTVLKCILALLAALGLAAGGYVIYFLTSFSRIDDAVALDIREPQSGAAIPGQEYAALSWNIGFAAYSSDYSFFMDGGKYSRALSRQAVYDNMAGVSRVIAEQGCDILLLQEVDQDGTRSYHVDEEALLLEPSWTEGYASCYAVNYDSPYIMYPLLSPHGANRSGLLSLFAFDAIDAVRRSLPIADDITKVLDLDRCYAAIRIPCANGRELCLYNVHLSAYTSSGSLIQEQWKTLFRAMEDEYAKGNYVLCGGDFNTDLLGDSGQYFATGSGEEYAWAQPLPEELIPEGFRVVADSGHPSCRNADQAYNETESFVLTADGFVVSANITVLSRENLALGFAYSDHEPVVMRFILQP